MKKATLIFMLLAHLFGYTQQEIWLDMPEISGVTYGETVTIPVIVTDVTTPNNILGLLIYIEWENAILDVQSIELSPEMASILGEYSSFIFAWGSTTMGDVETCVCMFTDIFPGGETFSIYPGIVIFNITTTYMGDGSNVPGTGGTALYFQQEVKALEVTLTKSESKVLDEFVDNFIIHYDIPAGSVNLETITNNWTGAIDTDWFNKGNWSLGTSPTYENVNIQAMTNMPEIINGSATCLALSLSEGAMLTLGTDGFLTAFGVSTFDGDLYIIGGSFIDNGYLAGDGMLYFKRLVTSAPTGSLDGWHFISSPLASSFTNWDIYDYYINTWDETESIWVDHFISIPDCIPSSEIQLAPGMGWSIKFADWFANDPCALEYPGTGTEIDFDGPIANMNYLDISYPVTYTNNGSELDGYNLVGNPYPCSIDANSIWFPYLDGSVNIYNKMMDNQFYEWTKALGLGSLIIAPTQGFFVRAIDNGYFYLSTSDRTHGGTFYKDEVDNLLKLSATGNDKYDETFIRFMEGTSTGYDLGLDAKKLFAPEDLPSLYTTSGTQELAIDVQLETNQVPMSFRTLTPGIYTIAAFQTSNLPIVYLQDLQTGDITDLLVDSYEFNHTSGIQNFIVHFETVGISKLNANTVKIWSSKNNIVVNVLAGITGEITVYNMMGQEVARTDIEAFETQIKVSDVNTTYIVKVISESNTVTGKVYVK